MIEALVALLVSGLLAAVLAPRALADFAANGWTRVNYRGADLPFPAAAIAVGVSFVALVPLAAAGFVLGEAAPSAQMLALAFGVAFLGLLDDLLDAPARGMRGHGAAILSGGFSTGALKAIGTLALALTVLADGRNAGEYALAVAVLVLCTNVFNLLDLRPGRAAKAFVIVAVLLLAVTRDVAPLGEIGLFAGPLLVLGVYDLRERAMLGDTGSNLLGVLAGMWIVTALGVAGQLAALGVLVAVTAYGELRSISRAVDRYAPLRALDQLGRPRHATSAAANARPAGKS